MKFLPLCFFPLVVLSQNEPAAQIVENRKIWDAAPHNAFTDLVRWKDQWWCAFREGTGHVNYHGKLRIIRSSDGNQWESAALMSAIFADLRDAKLCVTPKNELMLSGAAAMHPPIHFKHQSLAWITSDGSTWSEASKIGDIDMWLWRVVWHKGTAYSVGYSTGQSRFARLYSSKNGREFTVLVDHLSDAGYPNETGMVFPPDDSAVCLLRRDGDPRTGANHAYLGTSKPPYTEWKWKSTGQYVGGPCLIRLPDGRIVAGGRLLPDETGKARVTALWWVNPATADLTEIVRFPSGGDTSYPGLVWHDGLLWVSYYSSHEGKTSIYLAKVKLPEK